MNNIEPKNSDEKVVKTMVANNKFDQERQAQEKMSMKKLAIFFDRIEDSTPNYELGYN